MIFHPNLEYGWWSKPRVWMIIKIKVWILSRPEYGWWSKPRVWMIIKIYSMIFYPNLVYGWSSKSRSGSYPDHLLHKKLCFLWVKLIFIYSRKNKVFSGLNECSSTLDKITIYFISVKWIFIYSRKNKVFSGWYKFLSYLD